MLFTVAYHAYIYMYIVLPYTLNRSLVEIPAAALQLLSIVYMTCFDWCVVAMLPTSNTVLESIYSKSVS